MISASEITAVVVTKGDRDLSPIWKSLKDFGEVLTPIGSPEFQVYARWMAAARAKFEYVAVQDDDTIVDWPALLACHQPGRVTCNMPERWRKGYDGTGISLVGFGAILPRSWVLSGFVGYDAHELPRDEVFLRECDRVWTHEMRNMIDWAEVPIQQLDYSSASDRMYLQQRTPGDYAEIRRRLALVDGRAA